jgi:hypothetical protein
MSGECDKCGEHALDCKCLDNAKNAGEMAIKITEVLMNNVELSKYAPDALIRVLVYFAKNNGWSLDKISKESLYAIKYYYENEK